jgi:hypothetical protein
MNGNMASNRGRESFDDKDVQSIIQREDDPDGNRLLKCKICGVKFDNPDAFEGHIAAGYLSLNSATEERPSGPGHLAKTPYMCDVCGRGFPTIEQYDTHRLQH